MEIVNNGTFMQEKQMSKNKCAICSQPLFLQVYQFDKRFHKIIHCKNCKTFSHLKNPKKYNTDFKTIEKPEFLNKK